MSEIFPKSTPVQESELPDDSQQHASLSSLDTRKRRLFGTEHDSNTPNIDAHADRQRGDPVDMTMMAQTDDERPHSADSEPVENEDTSAMLANQMDEVPDHSICETNDPNCETHIHDQDTNPHDEEVIYRRQTERKISEGNDSFLNSSRDLNITCDECDMLRKSCYSMTSLSLWDAVKKGCISHDHCLKCHRKFWTEFKETLKMYCPNISKDLRDKNITELLKRLFQVEKKGQVEEIELTNVVYAIRFFGPLVNVKGESPLIQHVHEIVTKSSIRTTKGKNSWFAGLMSREEAECRLQGHENFTYLIRMSTSESDSGSFVISVMMDYVHHFVVQGDPEAANESDPFSCHLKFCGQTFRYITDVADYLKRSPIIDPESEDGYNEIWCRYICQGLPNNSAIVKYKKV